jgi:hypothetical protein
MTIIFHDSLPAKADIIDQLSGSGRWARHFALHFDDRIVAIEHLTQNGTRSQGM